MSKTPVPVPKAVYDGLEAIRRSGLTNMLDRPRVIEIAELWGDDATAAWVRTHRAEYAKLIFAGVTIDDEEAACAD